MNDNKSIIKELQDNIIISIFMFPPVHDGKVEFIFPEKIKAHNGYISFSAVVNISQKKEFDHILLLKLIQVEKNNNNSYNTFKLSDIHLNKQENAKIYNASYLENEKIISDEYPIRSNIRYSFEDVPILKKGIYALSVVFEDNDSFKPLNCCYFVVE